MEFDLSAWGLWAIPLAFVMGWMASRIDGRQMKREHDESPKAYYKGLNLLLNEQQDKAIDAFIEAVQNDPDTTDLHFALGNLFRRRGEFERSVRVHQHLLQRADLPATDRARAQHALAQDFMKAGLFDRAEAAFRSLLNQAHYDREAKLALLNLYERSRDWRQAAEMAQRLQDDGAGSFASRMAHHWCELALEADAKGLNQEAEQALQKARQAAPDAARPRVIAGQRALAAGHTEQALKAWDGLRHAAPQAFELVACAYAEAAKGGPWHEQVTQALELALHAHPSLELIRALATVKGHAPSESPHLLPFLRAHPTLSAAQAALARPAHLWDAQTAQAVTDAVEAAGRPLRRYRCAACGFEAQRYFWQCPGCLSWDSFPTQRIEDQ